MFYQDDWFMRQIEMFISALLGLFPGNKDEKQDEFTSETVTGESEKLKNMIENGDLCGAEDRLFEMLSPDFKDGLYIAAEFYRELNNFSDEELESHNFSREEIKDGLLSVCKIYGYNVLPGI